MQINRRQFLASTATGALALGLGRRGFGMTRASKPNILVIMVDEMRVPYGSGGWIPEDVQRQWMPNLYQLWSKSACFQNHFTAATACSPSRASLLTGLYAHQHYLLMTIKSPVDPFLQPRYPTYGRVLKSLGYDPWWWGKWHLSNLNANLGIYGFSGGEIDGPNAPLSDEHIARQFEIWLGTRSPSNANPFCTTVSFINPHQIFQFWQGTDCFPNEAGPFPPFAPGFLDASYFAGISINGIPGFSCTNFEDLSSPSTPKPSLQLASIRAYAKTFGDISYDLGTASQSSLPPQCLGHYDTRQEATVQPFNYWYTLLQLYMYLHSQVDHQIGVVLNALKNSPFAADTIVIFTSDHGEYAGAHGMRGKSGSVYREAMHVPFTVYDPTGTVVRAPGVPIDGYTSSVDLMPFLLTLAENGSTSTWSSLLPYLAGRLSLYNMLQDPGTPGRPYVLHTSDENSNVDSSYEGPRHVIGYRTENGVLGTYSNWSGASIETAGQEIELYDFSVGDTSEVENVATPGAGMTQAFYQNLFGPSGAVIMELRAPLPSILQPVQDRAIREYTTFIRLS